MENLQRQDLHYFEEAAAIADYLRRTGATQEEAAAQLGRSDYNIVTRKQGLPPGRSAPRPPGNPNCHDDFLLRVLRFCWKPA